MRRRRSFRRGRSVARRVFGGRRRSRGRRRGGRRGGRGVKRIGIRM